MRSTRFAWTFGTASTAPYVLAALLAALLLNTPSARAEWAFDAYLGAPFPDTEDLGGGNRSEFDGNVVGGARLGYFLSVVKHFDAGLHLDVSGVFQDIPNFKRSGTRPDGSTVTVDAGDIDFNFVPITPLFLIRVPLGYSSTFANGRYQFYGGGGPSLIWSEVNGGFIDDQSLDLGADVRAGFNFLILPNWGIFTEYRFTYFEPDFNDDTAIGGIPIDFGADIDSRTHYVMFGTGLRF
jgi:hypothetical protein